MMQLIATTITVLCVIVLASLAHAAPPAGADPNSPVGQWFQSLAREDGMSCCSMSDCRPAQADDLRVSDDDGLQVKLESRWETVPEYKIVRREDNPIGKSVICKAPDEVYCVIPYSGL
ncbi:MAG TPA: hypothetical protein VGG27_01290 [Magnetospirillaceae bacterium]|jgi:hypothetical protein